MLVFNGSVAGETTSEALERLPSALQYGADLVIVELGGNDMLSGTDPRTVYYNLDNIIRVCKADAIYPTLAKTHGIPLYPFFLQGVFGHPRLM